MDLTGDGKLDLLTGSYPGELYLFRGSDGGGFAARESIKGTDGKDIKVGYAAQPFAVDWDRDGDLDLLCGDIEGNVVLLPRPGAEPRFDAKQPLKVKVNGDAGPIVADWDRDGVLDLIVGAGDGAVMLFRGQGAAGAPQLQAGTVLVGPVRRGGNGTGTAADGHGIRAKPCVADWNGDGQLDLLVGDYTGMTTAQNKYESHGFVWFYARTPATEKK